MVRCLHLRLATAIAWGFVTLSLSGAVAGHSRDEATVPSDGAILKSAPATIAIRFDKPIRVTVIGLTDSDGEEFALERTDAMAPVTRFEATPEPLPAGTYRIDWRGLSADGHPMSGGFSFEIRP